ncbi:MAG: dUTP diphosphatase [Syntrophobacterales bacterium]|jgi:dUTP pyrophosphatase|nr:dUTP diphosphatase [Syntrophobacterales bacterium]
MGNGMQEKICVPIMILPGHDDLNLPQYMTSHAAGMDVCAAVESVEIISPGAWKKIPTGFAIALPLGYEGQIRPRSGLAVTFGVTVLNAPGTIDADYRGEIGVILINHGPKPFEVKRGERIAQLIIQPVCRCIWQKTSSLDDTERGAGGFGHTSPA